MSNVMTMKGVRNKPSRNGFDLSTKVNFTAKCGELLPVTVFEVLNGDRFQINMRAFARTQPLNTSAYARVREYYDFFYVPYSLLWNRANDVLSQMDYNQQHATQLTPDYKTYGGEMPFLTMQQIGDYIYNLSAPASSSPASAYKFNFFGYDRALLSCKLLEYLGYGNFYNFWVNDDPSVPADPDAKKPNFLYNLDVNIFGLLAYQKIYSDFYRDEQWEKPSPSTFNVDYMTGEGSMAVPIPTSSDSGYLNFYQNYNLFDLRYCNWQKDLYHGILPNPQYGDTSVVPINYSDNMQVSGVSQYVPFVNVTDGSGTSNLVNAGVNTTTAGNTAWVPGIKGTSSDRFSFTNGFVIDSDKGLSQVGTLSILALRQYEFLQKWKEIAQANDQNYKAQTKAIWGVDVSDLLSDRCMYLGGINTSLDINEVVNTNITGDNAAEIAGKGISVSNGTITLDNVQQPGLLMCIYHCMPIVDYTVNYTNPSYLRVNAEDFANPVFDRVGMEALPVASILNEARDVASADSVPILGYVPRYATYKTNIDRSIGAFRNSLSHWVVSYGTDDIKSILTNPGSGTSVTPPDQPNPVISSLDTTYVYLKVNPNMLDPIFATKAVDASTDTDQFLISSYFDTKVVRNLDVDGLPY